MKYVYFIPNSTSDVTIIPVAAKEKIPDWYKKSEVFVKRDGQEYAGTKKCIPLLDSLISGYFLLLSSDVYIEILKTGQVSISYPDSLDGFPLVHERSYELGEKIPRPAGHLTNHLAWTPNWGFKTPRGYSSLVTHPLNRFDLPFTTVTGIMDTDKCFTSGNLPFFLKEGFEGVIPKGTPFAQIIPIKRKKWIPAFAPGLEEAMHKNSAENCHGGYKKSFWQKKYY